MEAEDAADRIFLSTVTVHEVERGIGLLRYKGASAKANQLGTWLAGLITTYEDKILPIDVVTSSLSGQMEASVLAAGHNPGMSDALIAGTAKHNDLTLVTDNIRHFMPFDIELVSPSECRVP